MNTLREKAHALLHRSEKIFKTDVIYFIKSGSWSAVSFAVGSVASLATMIVFGNLVSKETYGTYNYLLSLASSFSFLILTSNTGVVRAVARNQENIIPYALAFQLRYNLLATGAIGLTGAYYLIHGNSMFAFSLFALAIAIPATAAYHTYEYILIGKKRFDILTVVTSLASVGSALATVLAVILTKSVEVLILTYCLSSIISNVWPYAYAKRLIDTSTAPSEEAVKELRRTSFHITFAGFFGAIAQYLDKILLFQVAGAANLAIYTFATAGPERLKGLIKNVFSVAMPKLTQRSPREIRSALYLRLLLSLGIGASAFVIYVLAAPILFKIFLPKYLAALPYSKFYALGLIAVPVSVYIGNIFAAQNMLRAIYLHGVGGHILRIALYVTLGLKWQMGGLIAASILNYSLNALYGVIIFELESRRIMAISPHERVR